MRNETVPPIEHRILHRNGGIRWVRGTIVRHCDESGSLVRYDGLVEDISERRRGEERLRSVLESAPDAILLVNREGRIAYANAQTETFFGFTREELLEQRLETLMAEPFHNGQAAERAASFHAPTLRLMSERRELLGRRKDGSEFPVEIALNPIDADEGRTIVVTIRSVAQRKLMEDAVRSNLEMQSALSLLLRLSLEPLSLEELLGKSLETLYSLPWMRLDTKGAIFLVENESQTLVRKAHRWLPESLLSICHQVPLGRCLCGKVAESRKLVFTDRVDERHQTCCPDMAPHGHYCVPIFSEEALLGVLCLYVKEGHRRNPAEERFLTTAADTLAGMVKRKRAEESLRKSEERFDLAVRGSDAGIWDWDLLTNQVYYSPRWKSMLGYEDNEIADRFSEWERRLHPDDRENAFAHPPGFILRQDLRVRIGASPATQGWVLPLDSRPWRRCARPLRKTLSCGRLAPGHYGSKVC